MSPPTKGADDSAALVEQMSRHINDLRALVEDQSRRLSVLEEHKQQDQRHRTQVYSLENMAGVQKPAKKHMPDIVEDLEAQENGETGRVPSGSMWSTKGSVSRKEKAYSGSTPSSTPPRPPVLMLPRVSSGLQKGAGCGVSFSPPRSPNTVSNWRGGQMGLPPKIENRKTFDQDLLKSIYDMPYKKARRQGALMGGGILGLMSMPFGPIGMAGGGMLGALCGGAIGVHIDRRTSRTKLAESEVEKRRLKSLVRWAMERFHEDEEIIKLIEMVTLEFKPIAEIASGSKNARKLLKLLDDWISQKKVTRNLWVYMDRLLQQWQDLNRGDFLRCMRVFQVLTTMYRYSIRMLDDEEVDFLHRMERLLEHESVKLVMAHAQSHPNRGDTKVMECMVFADALGVAKRRGSAHDTRSRSPRSPRSPRSEVSPANEPIVDVSDDDGSIESYRYSPSPEGLVVTPSQGARERAGAEVVDDTNEDPRTIQQSKGGVSRKQSTSGPGVLALKKPFFRNWDDFLDFDVDLKHKMPITLSEFELLMQKEAEPLKGWDLCVDKKEIRVAKIQTGEGGITLRAWASVPGVDMYAAFHLFYHHSQRVKWDKVFAHMEVIGEEEQGCDILYSLMKVTGVTPRDFLQFRRVRMLEDDRILIVLRSAEHPLMPEQKGIIRAESFISGYILQQTYDKNDNSKVLSLFLMSCNDIKGLVPKWIINMVAPKKPAEWVESLKKAALEYQAAFPNFRGEVMAGMERFRVYNPCDYELAGAGPEEDQRLADNGNGGDGVLGEACVLEGQSLAQSSVAATGGTGTEQGAATVASSPETL